MKKSNTHSTAHWPPLLGALTALALLAGCNTSTPTPTPGPAVRPKGLVHGAVNSLVYDALKSNIAFTPNDGSQKLEDYDLVVVDGDSFSGDQLKTQKLIHTAIRSGKWVLGLDVAADDKKDGLGSSLGAASPGNSPAYLVRRSRSPEGTLVNTVVDLSGVGVTTAQRSQQIFNYVNNPSLGGGANDPDIPGRALHVIFHHITPYQVTLPQNKNPAFNGFCPSPTGCFPRAPSQTSSWNISHDIHLFLDANTNPQGDYQHMVIYTDAIASPNQLAVNNHDQCDDFLDQCEVAWIQTRFDTSYTITPGGAGGFVLQSTSPTNTNNTVNVTTGSSFNVGYNQMQGVFGSYTYSNSVTRSISDWGISNGSGNNKPAWSYFSQNTNGTPTYDGRNISSFDPSAWFYYLNGVAPQTPNELSTKSLQYTTSSYWTNNQVSNDWVTVGGTDNAWYTDAWVVLGVVDDDPNNNSPHCIGWCQVTQHMARYNNSQPWSLQVNLATVVPVRTKSLTFSPNPVVAGQSTTATLTLESPTPIDAVLLISSDKPGIAPDNNTYTIPAGSDSISFNINTGAQGCQPQSATITAFYAEGQNGVLSVNPPPNCP